MAHPEPQVAQQLVEPQEFAQQAAANDHHQGAEEEVDAHDLAAGLLAADGLGQ